MTKYPSFVIASCSVVMFAVVNATAVLAGPAELRSLLMPCGIAAVAIAMHTAILDPDALKWALLATMPPVIALAADASAVWLMGLLGVLLLVASELSATSWQLRVAGANAAIAWQRIQHVGHLCVVGLAASWAVGLIASEPSIVGGVAAVVLGGAALVAIAIAVFGRVI